MRGITTMFMCEIKDSLRSQITPMILVSFTTGSGAMHAAPVPVVEETNFLGVIFNRKLFFISRIKQKINAQKLKACCES